MRCLIVHYDTLGLRHDARILEHALTTIYPFVECYHLVLPRWSTFDYKTPLNLPEDIRAAAPFDVSFMLEHAHPNAPILEPTFSKSVIYIPNIEWMNELDETVICSGAVDKVLFKTRHSLDVFASSPLAQEVPVIAYVGWTSDDPLLDAANGAEMDFDRFLHVRGISWQKQTDVVMETWAANPRFPPLTVVMRFDRGFNLSGPMTYGDNVTVIMGEISFPELRRLQRSAGVHVNPSAAEGFGHSLNEGRGAGSLLITTDAPPMNELVRHGETGMLVEPRLEKSTPMQRSRFYPVDQDALTTIVEEALRMPTPVRAKMGRAARAMFLDDRERFHKQLAAVL
ncbi:MAG: glycosyltransferase [Thermomicrobiales bacterium]